MLCGQFLRFCLWNQKLNKLIAVVIFKEGIICIYLPLLVTLYHEDTAQSKILSNLELMSVSDRFIFFAKNYSQECDF